MCSVSHKVIYIVLQFSGNYAVRIFFSWIFADFERLEQVKFSNIEKMGKIHISLSKLRLTM